MRRLLCAAVLSAPLAPSLLQEEDPWRAMGAFENDTWLPRSTEQELALARADEAQSEASDEDDLNEIFSAWRAVLQSEAGEGWVRWDTRVHWGSATAEPSLWSERRVEGLSSAVSLRIADRERALLPHWRRFISAEADDALRAIRALPVERLRSPLAELSYRYPGTRASVRAALLLCELDRELARPQHARAWLSRAEHGASLVGEEALLSAVSARTEVVRTKQTESWESTDSWEVVDFALLTDDINSPASGIRGLTRWNQEEVFIQSAELGWTLGAEGSARAFALSALAELAGQQLTRGWKRPGSSWRHQPSARGSLVFSVLGRVSSSRSNTLIAFRPGSPPAPSWSLGQSGWRDSSGDLIASLEEAIGVGAWEFQPQSLAVDDLLIVQARRWNLTESEGRVVLVNSARPEAVALALELESGALVWKRSLASGSDLFADSGERFAMTRTPALSAPTPVLCGSELVFATGLGACAVLNLADGRPQRAVLGQRVSDGFPSAAAPTPTSQNSVLWAPHGGGVVYELALDLTRPALNGSPFTALPLLATGWTSVIGSYDGRPLVALARGGRHQIEHLGTGATRASRSVQLSLGEALVGAHALGSERLITASDRGLFVFDLSRGLYLVGHTPLDPNVKCLPQGLIAAGTRAWLLTDEGVYRLRARTSD